MKVKLFFEKPVEKIKISLCISAVSEIVSKNSREGIFLCLLNKNKTVKMASFVTSTEKLQRFVFSFKRNMADGFFHPQFSDIAVKKRKLTLSLISNFANIWNTSSDFRWFKDSIHV